MKKIIYTRPDGGLSVVHPIINTHPVPEDITEEQALKRAWDKLPAEAINPRIVDVAAIPADRTFRDAWTFCVVKGTKVDMGKAREIHRDRLRRDRAPLLAQLDVAFMKALEQGDEVAMAATVARKQALRDVTAHPAIEAAKTPEELAVVTPEALSAASTASESSP
jgi:hypothetical protein